MIWCTNHPNVRIPTFCKRCSVIWRCFFPVSIQVWSVFQLEICKSWCFTSLCIKTLILLMILPLRKKCPNTKFFLVRIFLYSDWIRRLRSKSPYPVRIQENTDQKKLRIWTLFTQCSLFLIANFAQASASVLKSNLLKYRIGYINGRYRLIQNELNKRKWLYFWERSIRFFIHPFTLTMQLLISRMHRSTLALSYIVNSHSTNILTMKLVRQQKV